MRTIAVVARKGGSGKTTVAVHLGIAAHLAGRTARVIDADPQGSATEAFRMRKGEGPECCVSTPAGLLSAQIAARTAGVQALLIDTPAGTEEGMSNAVVLSDLALLVVRPTFLDLSAAAYTANVLGRLGKPALVVLNQAPPARDGIEPPAVRKAKEVLRLLRLPMVPVVLRTRASYQTGLESGRSAVETAAAGAAAAELAQAWTYVERFAFAPAPDRPWEPQRPAAAAAAAQATAPAETPAGADLDRLVIQNWNPHPGYVPLGDADLELDPGQAVTLWVRRSAPTPVARAAPAVGDGPVILSDEETLRV